MGDKQNDVFVFNPKNNKENMKTYIRKRLSADS